jgi:hypothetical protein
VPEFPVDPTELVRMVDRQLRAAIGTTMGASEVSAAINRLADEAARLNSNIEALKPTVEAIERHMARSSAVVDSVQGIQQMIRRTVGGRSANEQPDRTSSEQPGSSSSEQPGSSSSEQPPGPAEADER